MKDSQPQDVKACANCGHTIARFEHTMTKTATAEFHELIKSPVRMIDGVGEVCQRCYTEHTS